MGRINILDPVIAEKIAAGEVVESPASVVKELLENSIDANADNIEIHLKDGGLKEIRILDNGSGIAIDDIKNAFLKHATSKIKDIDDLWRVKSMGFRGEALSSIAAVSICELKSKEQDADEGRHIRLEGGREAFLRPVNIQPGTEVIVSELFFNTPARKKFLKSKETEFKRIIKTVTPYALLYNNIGFLLTNNGRPVINARPEEPSKRISGILGIDARHILNNSLSDGYIVCEIFLSDINIQRPYRDMQFVYVNERPVVCYEISASINEAYRAILPPKRFPFFMCRIQLDPSSVDVNIHPTKREVKLKDIYKVSRFVKSIVEAALKSGRGRKAGLTLPQTKTYNTLANTYRAPIAGENHQPYITQKEGSIFSQNETKPNESPSERRLSDTSDTIEKLINSRFIGQLWNTYLLFESPSSLLLMDQHAAAERVNYERLLTQIKSNKLEVQYLSPPFTITLLPSHIVLYPKIYKLLQKLGFETELWENTLAINCAPVLIADPSLAVAEIFEDSHKDPEIDLERIARAACRQSIMARDSLTPKQVSQLVSDISKCQSPMACPHGRPTIVEISKSAIKRLVDR